MNLDELLTGFPWERTRDVLWEEPSAVEKEPTPADARAVSRLISAQRESQLDLLVDLSVTPIIAEPKAASRVDPTYLGPPIHELRAPRAVSRLFLERVARVGKDLGRLSAEAMQRVDPANADLGRVLRLIALAAERRVAERDDLEVDWVQISPEADLGIVLTPMYMHMVRGRMPHNEESARLADALQSGIEKRALRVAEDIAVWAAALSKEGAARMLELRRGRVRP
jgi:hypothetical protein